jgi:hypothetical protein
MKRAERRHHARRMKAKVLNWAKQEAERMDYMFGDADQYRVVRQAETRKRCSCWMCGNPRKYQGERTRQKDVDWREDD